MRAFAVAALLLLSIVAPLSPQTLDDLCASRVVRWDMNDHLVEGYLLESPVAGQPLKVQQAGVSATQKELAWNTPSLACQVRKSQKGRNALIGLGLGALLGGAMGFAGGDDTNCWPMCFSAGEKAAVGAIGFGLVGALSGAIAAPGAVWTPLNPANGAQRVGLIVNGHGVGVGVRF